MKQIKQVILGFEMAGAKIAAVCLGGGGENVRGTKLFRLGDDPSHNDSWLSQEQCTFKNPACPSRRIAIVFCSTHNGKGTRNQLEHSKEDGVRWFMLDGVIHGKSKGNVGARLVIENMCDETWCHYSELLWEDPHYFEHAVLSVHTENQKYFQESLNLNKEGNN